MGMNLNSRSRREILRWAFWSILIIIGMVFLMRVIAFEDAYYAEKEGSERAIVEDVNSGEDLIEVEPTETEVREYTVAPDRPRYLTVPKLGISRARVLAMGINEKGELDTPNNIFDVGWYESSGRPGYGSTMMIDGHNGGPHVNGVFKQLPSLKNGDVIEIERGDGKLFKYEVVENNTISLDEADHYMLTAAKSPISGRESLTLISCTGEWSQQRGTYLSRQFTRAVLSE